MPGKRITIFKCSSTRPNVGGTAKPQLRRQPASASAARGGSTSGVAPIQRPPREWRTRRDPLTAVSNSELVPLLQRSPRRNAFSPLEELQRPHPSDYGDGMLRTLHRRVRHWRAMREGEREIFFPQEHPPGHQRLSDFTNAGDLSVTIGGQFFAQVLY